MSYSSQRQRMIGKTLGQRYRLISQIGEGGMAFVYLAKDLKLERQVAIKVLHPHMAKNNDIRQRFVREAKAISSLDHPNVVRVYDYSESDAGQIWIVSEYIDGPHLAGYVQGQLDEGRLHPAIAALIVREICKALGAAHNRGIIHRDIKPENVMLTRRGQVKLMDFGIAKDMAHASMTQTGTFMGSPSYMSKEQIQGRDVDYRSDIYSLSVLFFEIVTGRLPFVGATQHDVIMKIVAGGAPMLQDLVPGVDEGLADLVQRGLQAEPAWRFQTIEEMGAALDGWLKAKGFAESHIELERYFRGPQEFLRLLGETIGSTASGAQRSRQITRTSIVEAKRQRNQNATKTRAPDFPASEDRLASGGDVFPASQAAAQASLDQTAVIEPPAYLSLQKTVAAADAAHFPASMRGQGHDAAAAAVSSRQKADAKGLNPVPPAPGRAARKDKPPRERLAGQHTVAAPAQQQDQRARSRRPADASKRRRPKARTLIKSALKFNSAWKGTGQYPASSRLHLPMVFLVMGLSLLIIIMVFKLTGVRLPAPLEPLADIFQKTEDYGSSAEDPQPWLSEDRPKASATGDELPGEEGTSQKPRQNSGKAVSGGQAAVNSPKPGLVPRPRTPTPAPAAVEPSKALAAWSSTPAAEIYLDGRKIGTTNAAASSSGWLAVASGTHTVELRRPGYRIHAQTIDVKAGGRQGFAHIALEKIGEATITFTTPIPLLGTKITLRGNDGQIFTFTLGQQRLQVKVPFGHYRMRQQLQSRKKERAITFSEQYKNLTFIVEFD